eukprot:1185557-Pleurochrysis_carterae.AAC.1
MRQSNTLAAQDEAFKDSFLKTAELLRDVGITEDKELRINLNFVPASTMKDRATRRSAQDSSPCARGDGEAADYQRTCAHYAVTNYFEVGCKAMDAVVR